MRTYAPTSVIKRHRNFSQDDYSYLRGKGWTDAQILKRWDTERGPTSHSAAVPDLVGRFRNGRMKAENAIAAIENDSFRVQNFSGYVSQRLNGYQIIEGSGRFGGQWAAKKPGEKLAVFGNKEDALYHAKMGG